MKKISIISNSNLGTFFSYLKFFKNDKIKFSIISTKKKNKQKIKNIEFNLLKNNDNDKFNDEAFKIIKKFKPNKIILFYTKKISKKIYNNYRTYNIHNSLLPNYKGLDAIRKSFRDKNKFICSSSHRVNEEFDSGKIITQIVTPAKYRNIQFFKNTSFYHRIILLNSIIVSNSNRAFSIINNETIISPGFKKKNLNYKFWK